MNAAAKLPLVLVPLALLSACGEGRLLIVLDRPTDENLDPLGDPRLSKFSLRVTHQGATTDQEVFRGSDSELTVGNVPVDSPFDLRLAGKTSTDEMLGVGLVLGVVADAESDTSVSVKFRKPIGYVAGGDSLQPVRLGSASAGASPLPTLSASRVAHVAAAPNGVMILAATADKLLPFRTADHQPLQGTALPAPPTCVMVSPDSRWSVTCHPSIPALGVGDLGQIGGGQDAVTSISLDGEPSKIAFGETHNEAWVLLDGLAPAQPCDDSAATLIRLDITTGQELERVELGRPVSDIAVDPRDNYPLLALPCEGTGALGAVRNGVFKGVAQVPAPRIINVSEQNILLVGSSTQAGQVQTVRYDLSRPGFETPQDQSLVELPWVEAYIGDPQKNAGLLGWISLPGQVQVLDAALAPDSQKALVAFQTQYASDYLFGQCFYKSQINVSGYMVVDLTLAGTIKHGFTQVTFDQCSANCLIDEKTGASLADPDTCAAVIRQDFLDQGLLADPEFEPAAASILFGG